LSEAVGSYGTAGKAAGITAMLAGVYAWFGRRRDEAVAPVVTVPEAWEQGQ
jgi:hypothetical protein